MEAKLKLNKGDTPSSVTMAEEPSTSLEATQETQGKDPRDPTKGLSGKSPMSDEDRSSGLSDIEESIKRLLAPDKPRFSGAARKRFKWLMQHGHSVEEARSLALKPIPKTEKGPTHSCVAVLFFL